MARQKRLDLEFIRRLSLWLSDNICEDYDLHKEILYPLLDKVFSDGDLLTINTKSGLTLDYIYRSGLAKEILLRDEWISAYVWEPVTTMAIISILEDRHGSCLICGAYFGDQVVPAADALKKLSSASKVLAVEPNADQVDLLSKNLLANNLSSYVEVVESFLWSEQFVNLRLDEHDSLAAAVVSDEGSASKTIESICHEFNVDDLSLIVLDIEGSELRALKGAESFLSRDSEAAPEIIFEVNSRFVDWSCGLANIEIVRYLESFGYSVFALRDGQSNRAHQLDRPELVPLGSAIVDGPPHGFNLIASKQTNFFSGSRFRFVDHVSPKYLRHRDLRLHAPLDGA